MIKEEDKAGTDYKDVPLFYHNSIKFGVMKELDNFTLTEIRSKLREEYLEVMAESDDDLDKLVPELFDVMQVGYTYLLKLQEEGKIIMENENIKHLEKLNKRGYIK